VCTGSIDEEVLLGKTTSEQSDEYGRRSAHSGGFGTLLARVDKSGNVWFENAIPGVTDELPGRKFWRERTDGTGFEDVKRGL
jgi:hypothetical protein